MIETSSDLPQKSSAFFGYFRKPSVIFGNLRRMLGNFPVAFGQFLENPGKSSESSRKSLENRQKRRYQYVYIINKIIL